jgi:hypothetical protein
MTLPNSVWAPIIHYQRHLCTYAHDTSVSMSLISLCTINFTCCNPNLGLVNKVRACKGVGQEKSLGVTSHVPESVGECEGMNLHTPKWAPTLGVGVSMDSQIFREWLQGSNHWINFFYIIEKLLEHRCLKWVRMTHLNT